MKSLPFGGVSPCLPHLCCTHTQNISKTDRNGCARALPPTYPKQQHLAMAFGPGWVEPGSQAGLEEEEEAGQALKPEGKRQPQTGTAALPLARQAGGWRQAGRQAWRWEEQTSCLYPLGLPASSY